MEMKEEVTDEEKDGIWQFPSCLIQDVKCVKEEVADEITIKEEGVYREVEDESNAHSSYEGFCCMDDTVGVWPAEVEMTGDCISQEWGSAYVKELGQISLSSCVQHERKLSSTACEKPVDHQKKESNQNNIASSCHHIGIHEEVPACIRKGVKVIQVHRCKLCNKTFTYPSDLDVHTRIIHSKRKSLDCEVKVKNESQPGKLYKCKMCSRRIYRYDNFRQHSSTHAESAHEDRQDDFLKVYCNRDGGLFKSDPEWKDFYFF